MKKFFKFIFKFVFIILILVLFLSYCSYDLVTKASLKKLQTMGSQMFGSELFFSRELSNGEKYAVVIENPENFAPGNMILLQSIENKSTNETNKNLTISGLTINYAINKDNKINLHVMRDNAKQYANSNLQALDNLNNLLEQSGENKDGSEAKPAIVQSITFINPTLLLFIDDKYQGITTIPSFALQYNDSEKVSLLKGVLDSVTHLTDQADKAVISLIN